MSFFLRDYGSEKSSDHLIPAAIKELATSLGSVSPEIETIKKIKRLLEKKVQSQVDCVILLFSVLSVRPCQDVDEETNNALAVTKSIQSIKSKWPSAFVIVASEPAAASAPLRQALFDSGANMVSSDLTSICNVLLRVSKINGEINTLSILDTAPTLFTCPRCQLPNLSEDGLWEHFPIYHIAHTNIPLICPICLKPQKGEGTLSPFLYPLSLSLFY